MILVLGAVVFVLGCMILAYLLPIVAYFLGWAWAIVKSALFVLLDIISVLKHYWNSGKRSVDSLNDKDPLDVEAIVLNK